MERFLWLIISMALTGMSVYLVFCIMKKSIYYTFSAKWQYRLFKMHFIFYLFPFVYVMSNVLQNIYQRTVNRVGTKNNTLSERIELYLDYSIDSKQRGVIVAGIFVVWLIGMILYYVFNLVCYFKTVQYFSHNKTCLNEHLDSLLKVYKKQLDVKGDVKIYSMSGLSTPIVLGFFSPRILIPESMLMCNNSEKNALTCSIQHELMHIKNKDLWLHLFFIVLHGVYWFVPLMPYVYRDMIQYGELACDEKVVYFLNDDERNEYGILLLHSIKVNNHQKPVRMVNALVSDKDNLKKRLLVIKGGYMTKYKRLYCPLVISILLILSMGIITTGLWITRKSDTMYGFKWDRSGFLETRSEWYDEGMWQHRYITYGEPHYIIPGKTKIQCNVSWFPITEDIQVGLMLASDLNERYTVSIDASQMEGEASFELNTGGIPEDEYYFIVKNPGKYKIHFDEIEVEWN